jgi:hypothetical protein
VKLKSFSAADGFVFHGDPDMNDSLRFRINNEFGWRASVPPQVQPVEV